MILFFESFILLTWFFIFSWETWKKKQLEQFILLYALPMTFIMEVINDVYFGSFGMVYPHSYFYLRPFNFPIPIILSGSLYCWTLHKLSLKMSRSLFNGKHLNFIYPLVIIFLLNTWFFIELIGQKSGYWVRIGGIQYTKVIMGLTYFFYFSFTVPSIVLSFITHHFVKEKKRKGNASHIVFKRSSS